jgi:hypothetical protein
LAAKTILVGAVRARGGGFDFWNKFQLKRR